MADPTELKKQRDRFLAFSFASADLFLEVSGAGLITFALGAAKSLTGVDDKKLMGQMWLNVFSTADRINLSTLQNRARDGQRCGPIAVTLDDKLAGGARVFLTALRLPGLDSFFVTVSFGGKLMQQIAEELKQREEYNFLSKDAFIDAATDIFSTARELKQDLNISLLDLPEKPPMRQRMGEKLWDKFMNAVRSILGASTVDGFAVAEVDVGKYSIVHDPSLGTTGLTMQIEKLAKEMDPEGAGFEVLIKTITTDLSALNEQETMKALVYTINEFDRKGTAMTIDSLNTGFRSYAKANATKAQTFKNIITQSKFDFHFQPIVQLNTRVLEHYELLTRFQQDGPTHEWIIFAEDIGMAPEFDLAVCDRAINHIQFKAGATRTRFAVNLSSLSIQNEAFLKTLQGKLTAHKDLASRLIFEITESTTIKNLDQAGLFIKTLQRHGFKICLDDFGSGASSPQVLQQLSVDYVKIDGRYTRHLLDSPRDAALMRSLVQLAKDLKITPIAERIETEEQHAAVTAMGITLAQGFLYSEPLQKPEYLPPMGSSA